MANEKATPNLFTLEPRLLLLYLLIAGPIALIGSLFIVGSLRSDFNTMIGDMQLGGAAADTARYLDSYLLHNMTNVSVLAAVPSLQEAVDASNRRYGASQDQISNRLEGIDEDWVATRGTSQFAMDLVGNETSDFLRRVQSLNPTYTEILLTDTQGALVAATNVTTDYYQADETWWRDAYGDGTSGTIFLGDVQFDQSAGAQALEVAVPLRESFEEGGYQVIGVLKAVIEVSDLASVIGSVRRGATGRAVLVRGDGTVIVGPEADDIMKRQFSGMQLLREAFSDGRSSFSNRAADGEVWLVGFSRLPQPSPSPNLDWYVVVQQRLDEASAPARTGLTNMTLFFFGLLASVILFSLYLHYKLVRRIRQVDLREELNRAGAQAGPV
jgi:hypothetical protein